MNKHNDLLNKGCPKPVPGIVLLAGCIVVIALCVLGAIAMTQVN